MAILLRECNERVRLTILLVRSIPSGVGLRDSDTVLENRIMMHKDSPRSTVEFCMIH